jgi:predicted acetyltransferase
VPVTVRLVDPAEFRAIITLDGRAFGFTYIELDHDDLATILELDRTLVAADGAEIVGSTSAFTMELTVPGGARVPAAGVTWVGVMPTHRRRGILRELMARQLGDLIEGGEPLAVLTASEGGIYGRFGYGVATQRAGLLVLTKQVRLCGDRADDHGVRFAEPAEARAVLPGIYDRFREQQPGTVSRPEAVWDFTEHDREHLRDGASAMFYLVHPDGFATYRRRHGEADGLPVGEAVVRELVAVTPEAHAALWRVLLGLDLVERLTSTRFSLHDPLPWLVDDPRQVRTTGLWDDLWLRILHVPRALEARRYLSEDGFGLQVVDPLRPDVGGRFEVEGGPDGACCRRSTAEPDLVMDVATLGSLYLGGVRATTLARAGRIEERTPGTARRADAFFRSDPPPHNQSAF